MKMIRNESVNRDPASTFRFSPKKVALVAIDWTRSNKGSTRRREWEVGFDPFFEEIIKVANGHACDTVLFALWSRDAQTMNRRWPDRLFQSGPSVKAVILGSGKFVGKKFKEEEIQVWHKDAPGPHGFRQAFARSIDPSCDQRALIENLSSRSFGSTLVLACGESNIVKTIRGSQEIRDPHGFLDELDRRKVKVILNPIHDYMTRPEMKRKRSIYSEKGRSVLSVWNRGSRDRPEATDPWTVFSNGEDVTRRVSEVTFAAAEDIRIGVHTI